MALEAAQHVEGTRHHLNDVTLPRKIAGEHCLLTQPLRTSSHDASPFIPPCGIKFHLQNKLPQAICGHNKKPLRRAHAPPHSAGGGGMPENKIVTQVAGRLCAFPGDAGGSVGGGGDIRFSEGLKTANPVATTAS